jgi:hypothetical protein
MVNGGHIKVIAMIVSDEDDVGIRQLGIVGQSAEGINVEYLLHAR